MNGLAVNSTTQFKFSDSLVLHHPVPHSFSHSFSVIVQTILAAAQVTQPSAILPDTQVIQSSAILVATQVAQPSATLATAQVTQSSAGTRPKFCSHNLWRSNAWGKVNSSESITLLQTQLFLHSVYFQEHDLKLFTIQHHLLQTTLLSGLDRKKRDAGNEVVLEMLTVFW